MTSLPPSVLSSGTFVPEPTPGRLLAALSSPVRLFVTVTLTFSVVGGLLQVVGSARGPLARSLGTAVTVHVAGNLVASTVAIALVVTAHRLRGRAGQRARTRGVSTAAATLGGALGGGARLPLELLVGTDLGLRSATASVLTEAGWFLIAALLSNTVARLARNERDTRDALAEALLLQAQLRTQMLDADLRTRREVAEWLHGRLQAELLVAADEVRRTGPTGEEVADRLTRLRDDELRALTRSLHPTLAEVDLEGALGELARRLAGSVEVSVRLDRDLVRAALPRAVAVAAYRVCEEAVANAVKHGGARHVTVTFERAGADGRLVVADDGRTTTPDGAVDGAMDAAADGAVDAAAGSTSGGPGVRPAPGLGLALVDTHVRAVGGAWDLQLDPRSGATLTVTVPLAPPR